MSWDDLGRERESADQRDSNRRDMDAGTTQRSKHKSHQTANNSEAFGEVVIREW